MTTIHNIALKNHHSLCKTTQPITDFPRHQKDMPRDNHVAKHQNLLHNHEQHNKQESDPETKVALARQLLESSTAIDDHCRAVQLLESTARFQYSPALLHLGLMHTAGIGPCPVDNAIAANYFRAAIQAGNTTAFYYLACIVLDGYADQPPDSHHAIKLLESAVQEEQDPDAMILLARLLQPLHTQIHSDNWSRARDLLQSAVHLNHPHAPYHLAQLYLSRADEKLADKTIAAQFFDRAAKEHRDTHSMYSLALLYRDGYDNVSPNIPAAINLLQEAIDIASAPNAMVELALLYRKACTEIPNHDDLANDLILQVDTAIEASPDQIDQGAVSALEDAAARNDHFAQFLLGLRYKEGDPPFKRDTAKAEELLESSADNGNSDAMYHLALLVLDNDGHDDTADVPRAIQLLHRAEKEGDNVAAINLLADLYTEGFGEVDANLAQARSLYERGLSLGDGRSMNSLAMMHAQGLTESGERDIPTTIDILNRAVANGNAKAMYNLGCMLRNDLDKTKTHSQNDIAELFQRAIEADNHVRAMISLADLWLEGFDGTVDRTKAAGLVASAISAEKTESDILINLAQNAGLFADEDMDDVEAWKAIFQTAVENGNGRVFYSIGCLVIQGRPDLYSDGHGGARWFQRAIEASGDELATLSLSRLLLTGLYDLSADEARARQLLRVAADNGNTQAMYLLAMTYDPKDLRGETSGKDIAELYRSAARKGHSGAILQLARVMRDGLDNVEENTSEAVRLFEQAAEGGDVSAMVELAELLVEGQPGVSSYRERSVALLEHALSGGAGPEASVLLGRLVEQEDMDRAEELYEQATEEDDSIGMLLLARILLKRDIASDEERIVELLMHAVYGFGDNSKMAPLERLMAGGIEQPIKNELNAKLCRTIEIVVNDCFHAQSAGRKSSRCDGHEHEESDNADDIGMAKLHRHWSEAQSEISEDGA